MDLLIDGDILAYRSAAACDGRQYVIGYTKGGQRIFLIERYKKDADAIAKSLETEGNTNVTVSLEYEPEPLKNATFLMEKALASIKDACEEEYGTLGTVRIFLSRGGSFREEEFPTYKNNRANLRRPEHLEALKDFLVEKHGAECEPGKYEADDMMAFSQNEDSVICSIDKDLLQVPGHHYNFVKKKFSIVEEEEGNRNLYIQMLTGDATDGIPGLRGVGPKTAEKILRNVHSPYMMYCSVLKAYYDKMPREDEVLEDGSIAITETEEDFQVRVALTVRAHARLLYLLRTEDDSWEPPEATV